MSRIQAGNTLLSQYVPPFVINERFRDGDILVWNQRQRAFVNQPFDVADLVDNRDSGNIVYVAQNGKDSNSGLNVLSPVRTIARALEITAAEDFPKPSVVSVLPGVYVELGDLVVPPNCGVTSVGGQYVTEVHAAPGFERRNMFLVSSGSYVQGFGFRNQEVDNFDDPTGGFCVAFNPGARIVRSPYIRDISQVSNYSQEKIAAPLTPTNSRGGVADLGVELVLADISDPAQFVAGGGITITHNGHEFTGVITIADQIDQDRIGVRGIRPDNISEGDTVTTDSGGTATVAQVGEEDFPNVAVGRGGGCLLADRSVLNPNSIFPYMLAFGATPRSNNGLGYVAKNGAGINGISSLGIFQRTNFYALTGGQITLNNSGTQFGDISMRATSGIDVVQAVFVDSELLTQDPVAADLVIAAADTDPDDPDNIINAMWQDLLAEYPDAIPGSGAGWSTEEEFFTRRDAANLLVSLSLDLRGGTQMVTQSFAQGLFGYAVIDGVPTLANPVFRLEILPAFLHTWQFILSNLVDRLQADHPEAADTVTVLINDVLVATVNPTAQQDAVEPAVVRFGSLIESLGHQFNNAGAGVNKNALPLNFRRPGFNRPVPFSVLQETGGRVRWSGADELNNQYFAGGTKINGITGKFEGRPFDISVRQIARRLANSRGNFQ